VGGGGRGRRAGTSDRLINGLDGRRSGRQNQHTAHIGEEFGLCIAVGDCALFATFGLYNKKLALPSRTSM